MNSNNFQQLYDIIKKSDFKTKSGNGNDNGNGNGNGNDNQY